jgi:hypothetical protein
MVAPGVTRNPPGDEALLSLLVPSAEKTLPRGASVCLPNQLGSAAVLVEKRR